MGGGHLFGRIARFRPGLCSCAADFDSGVLPAAAIVLSRTEVLPGRRKSLESLCTCVHNPAMRPTKTRWIQCKPGPRTFAPQGVLSKKPEKICLTLDEFEAVRLMDLEAYDQRRIAKLMRVHRSTVSRILSSARKKITEALVHQKVLCVEGGCCSVRKKGC